MQQDKTDTAHYRPTDGDIVEIVLRGPVGVLTDRGFTIGRRGGPSRNYIVPAAEHVISVTKVEPPEPEWRVGDVVIDADGMVLTRNDDDVWVWTRAKSRIAASFSEPRFRLATRYVDAGVIRPLTLLVRDGQVVSS